MSVTQNAPPNNSAPMTFEEFATTAQSVAPSDGVYVQADVFRHSDGVVCRRSYLFSCSLGESFKSERAEEVLDQYRSAYAAWDGNPDATEPDPFAEVEALAEVQR